MELEKRIINAAIFDMDGLMFDTETVFIKTWPLAAREFGYTVTEEVVIGATGLVVDAGREYFLKQYGADFPFDTIRLRRLDMAMEMIEREGLGIKKGLQELLTFLSSHGIKCAVATSSEHYRTDKYLRMANMTDTFDYVLCGGDATALKSKPAPDIFIAAAEKLGQRSENCIIFEDSENGVRAAAASGAFTVMIPDKKRPTAELRQLADRIFDDLGQAKAYLEENIK